MNNVKENLWNKQQSELKRIGDGIAVIEHMTTDSQFACYRYATTSNTNRLRVMAPQKGVHLLSLFLLLPYMELLGVG